MKTNYRELSASDITNDALLMLNARNCECWRNNNHATRGRQNNVKKGVPDIIGYNRGTGVSVWVEVKKNGDKMSVEQAEFLLNAHAKCLCLVACQVNDSTELIDIVEYLENHKTKSMKAISELMEEVDQIKSQDRKDLTTHEYAKAVKRMWLLNHCIAYLKTNPSSEFLEKEVARLNNRIDRIREHQPNFDKNEYRNQKEEKKIIDRYLIEQGVPELKMQLKTLEFLLN